MKPTINQMYHFHARAQFFVHESEINPNHDVSKMVDTLFKKQKIEKLCIKLPEWDNQKLRAQAKRNRKAQRELAVKKVDELNALWLERMMESDKGLIEKMTLFWHGHFACNTFKNPYHTIEINNILRESALGSFKTMLLEVARSSAMNHYLHLKENKKKKPNEDFARELCELFTLGRDVDYAEKDVVEIARAFAGWSNDNGGNHFVNERTRDIGEKTIFGKTGNFNGEDVLNMILLNKNTAKFIVQKVYKFFVQEELNSAHINECTTLFFKSDYDIEVLMKHIFKADWFYESKGKLVKSPIELIVGLGKLFDLKYPNKKSIKGIQYYLGHVLFTPPNVAGWPGGRHWIDASRLALRMRLGSIIVNKGYIMDELTPELDAMFKKWENKKVLKFYENVDWKLFWKRNKNSSIFDLIIRTENKTLKVNHTENTVTNIIHLISTPDFQLT